MYAVLKSVGKQLFRPGMLAMVDHQLSVQHNALLVPEMAVSTDIHGDYIFTVVSGHADKVYITEGQHLNGMVQIKSGVKPGDEVVTAGQQKLDNHDAVKIIKHS